MNEKLDEVIASIVLETATWAVWKGLLRENRLPIVDDDSGRAPGDVLDHNQAFLAASRCTMSTPIREHLRQAESKESRLKTR